MKIRTYRYYLVDLDRTIWDFDRNSEHAISLLVSMDSRLNEAVMDFEGCPQEEALHRFFLKYDVINLTLWAEYEKGGMTKADLRWRRFYDAFRLYGIDDESLARRFGNDYLEQMVEESGLMPGAREMLEAIRKSGSKAAIVSNGFKEVQHRKLRKAGIEDYFDAVIVSEEAGCLKPSPGIFAYALRKLSGIDPERQQEEWKKAKKETLMIGDDLANDIEGAQVFGIDQFYYNHKHLDIISGATYEYDTLEPLIR